MGLRMELWILIEGVEEKVMRSLWFQSFMGVKMLVMVNGDEALKNLDKE